MFNNKSTLFQMQTLINSEQQQAVATYFETPTYISFDHDITLRAIHVLSTGHGKLNSKDFETARGRLQ
jgi:hypothetical protein